jgi:hypothetical protein
VGSDAACMQEIGKTYSRSETTLETMARQADNLKKIFKKEGVRV